MPFQNVTFFLENDPLYLEPAHSPRERILSVLSYNAVDYRSHLDARGLANINLVLRSIKHNISDKLSMVHQKAFIY